MARIDSLYRMRKNGAGTSLDDDILRVSGDEKPGFGMKDGEVPN